MTSEVNHTPQGISATLASFALGLSLDAVPTVVRERAKHLLLDAIGLAYASQPADFTRVALEGLTALSAGDKAGATVIGRGQRLNTRDAMVMNGVLVHGLDFDDTHSRGVIHATASVLPCVFGVSELRGVDGAQTLAAYIAGMEAATRIGSVAKGIPSGGIPSDRCRGDLRLHAGGLTPVGPDRTADCNGAGHCAVDGQRQPRIPARRRLDQTLASGLGSAVGVHRGDHGRASATSAHPHRMKGVSACFRATSANSAAMPIWRSRLKTWASNGRSKKSRSSRCQPAISRMRSPTPARRCTRSGSNGARGSANWAIRSSAFA